jgi:hypothetical protein
MEECTGFSQSSLGSNDKLLFTASVYEYLAVDADKITGSSVNNESERTW